MLVRLKYQTDTSPVIEDNSAKVASDKYMERTVLNETEKEALAWWLGLYWIVIRYLYSMLNIY